LGAWPAYFAPEFGEPLVPGVLADGAWLASGDFGVTLVPAPDVEAPLLAPASRSFFILLCFARLCFVGFAVVSAVVSVLAPALAFGRFVFESTFAFAVPVQAAAGVWTLVDLSVLTDESAAKALKEIAAMPLTITGRSLCIWVSMVKCMEL
jgi:hypothetical protein